jgi:acetyltransferase-like isoleucine patch superfamily enzyme
LNPIVWLKCCIQRIVICKKFPTSVIYTGAFVDKSSTLGEYSVLFRDVALMNSSLGAYSYVQSGSVVCNAEIGKFCSIASGVNIGLPQHSISSVSSHPVFYLKNTPLPKKFSDQDLFSTIKKTVIGHDVWIGQNAIIMTGLNIATGAVIGAGAVVTRDVPAYAVVGGIPARIIKYRFEEKMRSDLLSTKWWEMPDKLLEKNFLLFQNPLEFVNVFKNNTLNK